MRRCTGGSFGSRVRRRGLTGDRVRRVAGEWAAFAGCPVDDPAMLAADGESVIAACLGGGAPTGTITLGSTTMPVGAVRLQFGALNQGGAYSLVQPAAGGLSGDPITVPGGLLGLMCPSDIPVISQICDAVVGSPLNTVTATSNRPARPRTSTCPRRSATGRPIMTLPVKIHLQNPFLDRGATSARTADPLTLKVANQTRPAAKFGRFDADGTPNPAGEMNYTDLSGATVAEQHVRRPGGARLRPVRPDRLGGQRAPGPAVPVGREQPGPDRHGFRLGGFANPRAFAPNQGAQLASRWHAAARLTCRPRWGWPYFGSWCVHPCRGCLRTESVSGQAWWTRGELP